MYSRELIREIHERLAATLPQALILFGGSYWYGEATAESDIDFYCILPLWRLWYLNRRVQHILNSYAPRPVHVVLVPQSWFKRGWYYVAGVDVGGILHQSGINRVLIIRNALKLSYFYYLRFIAEGNVTDWPKALKQLSVARFAVATNSIPPKLFSRQVLTTFNTNITADNFRQQVHEAKQKANSYFGWSWANYFMYNFHFLRRGRLLFLFKNPDIMVWRLLQKTSEKPQEAAGSLAKLTNVIFPIIVLKPR